MGRGDQVAVLAFEDRPHHGPDTVAARQLRLAQRIEHEEERNFVALRRRLLEDRVHDRPRAKALVEPQPRDVELQFVERGLVVGQVGQALEEQPVELAADRLVADALVENAAEAAAGAAGRGSDHFEKAEAEIGGEQQQRKPLHLAGRRLGDEQHRTEPGGQRVAQHVRQAGDIVAGGLGDLLAHDLLHLRNSGDIAGAVGVVDLTDADHGSRVSRNGRYGRRRDFRGDKKRRCGLVPGGPFAPFGPVRSSVASRAGPVAALSRHFRPSEAAGRNGLRIRQSDLWRRRCGVLRQTTAWRMPRRQRDVVRLRAFDQYPAARG